MLLVSLSIPRAYLSIVCGVPRALSPHRSHSGSGQVPCLVRALSPLRWPVPLFRLAPAGFAGLSWSRSACPLGPSSQRVRLVLVAVALCPPRFSSAWLCVVAWLADVLLNGLPSCLCCRRACGLAFAGSLHLPLRCTSWACPILYPFCCRRSPVRPLLLPIPLRCRFQLGWTLRSYYLLTILLTAVLLYRASACAVRCRSCRLASPRLFCGHRSLPPVLHCRLLSPSLVRLSAFPLTAISSFVGGLVLRRGRPPLLGFRRAFVLACISVLFHTNGVCASHSFVRLWGFMLTVSLLLLRRCPPTRVLAFLLPGFDSGGAWSTFFCCCAIPPPFYSCCWTFSRISPVLPGSHAMPASLVFSGFGLAL